MLGEVLVAILKDKSDFAILWDEGWYRIPVVHAPSRWPPEWMAFYQPKCFGEDAYRIGFYGKIERINVIKRRELFPTEPQNTKSDNEYFRIHLERLEELETPIPSTRPRRLIFIPTTREKFCWAEQINDLFDGSPLGDRIWNEFKQLQIAAERQWGI